MDKEQKRFRLSQIREERRNIGQKILYHRRQIDKLRVHGIDTIEWSRKRLQHWRKIELLDVEDQNLEYERKRILGIV